MISGVLPLQAEGPQKSLTQYNSFTINQKTMRTTIIIFIFIFITSINQLMAQNSHTPIELTAEEGQTLVTTRGDLKDGDFMEYLYWAWDAAVACFTEPEAEKFTGKHVLYKIDLPSYTSFKITVIPDDKQANFSLYAYEAGRITEANTVPNLKRCVRCEADFYSERPRKGRPQDHTRWVEDILAIRNPYQVLIGVVGANGLAEGGFELQIEIAPYRRPK